jgi:signal transduction histidine kinase
MKFTVNNDKLKNIDPSIQLEIKEKLYSAEKNIANIRILVVFLNIVVYFLLMDKSGSIHWLAVSISIAASLYAVLVAWTQLYRKFKMMLTSLFTSSADGFLISLWLIATGGIDSPFYVLWYVSILAIALRYTLPVILRIAFIYTLLYLGIVFWDTGSNIVNYGTELTIRTGYLLLIGMLGGLLSKETIDQIEAKILIKKSEEEIRKREAMLVEAHEKLEQRVMERTKELDETNRQLLKINEDIDNFVYSASHDLKSPIINLGTLVDILFEDESITVAEKDDLREKIKKSIERMKATIDHLAQVARVQKEVYDDIEKVSFRDILKEVIEDNAEIIRATQAIIEYDFNGADCMVYSKISAKSILYNLISNAIKYRDSERVPWIEIKTQCEENYLVLSVKDNGLGIDMERHGDRLFTIFRRFHDHTEGTGIGLYMVKRLVEKNDGKIELESMPGKGSTFKIFFKINRETSLAPLLSV